MSIMLNKPIPKKTGANPPPLKNIDSTLIDTHIAIPPEPNIVRIITHAAEVKFINNHYTTPVIIEFSSSDSETTLNISVKYHKLFTVIKILDPLVTINIRENH